RGVSVRLRTCVTWTGVPSLVSRTRARYTSRGEPGSGAARNSTRRPTTRSLKNPLLGSQAMSSGSTTPLAASPSIRARPGSERSGGPGTAAHTTAPLATARPTRRARGRKNCANRDIARALRPSHGPGGPQASPLFLYVSADTGCARVAASNLTLRLLSAAVVVPPLLFLMFRGPAWGFFLLVLLAAALAVRELLRLTHRGDTFGQGVGIAMTLASAAATYAFPRDPRVLWAVLLLVPIVGMLLPLARLGERSE